MKPMMNSMPTTLVVALFAISHDGEAYTAGDLFEVPKTQAPFLFMAKCVREPTSDEVEAWRDQQELTDDTVNTALSANQSTQLAHPVAATNSVSDTALKFNATGTDIDVLTVSSAVASTEPQQTKTDAAATVDTQAATPDMATDVVVDDAEGATDDADVLDDSDGVNGVVIGEAVNAPVADASEADNSEALAANESTNPYDGWLKKDLNAELDVRGIEHDAQARNDVLEALLVADDAKQG